MTLDTPQPSGTPTEPTSSPAPVPTSPTPNDPITAAAPAPVTPAPAPAPAAETFVPLTAEAFNLPEGFSLDNDAMGSFLGILNNRELSPTEMGQKLLDLQANLTTKSSEAGSQAWKDQQQAWQNEIAADQTIGGQNLQNTIASIGNLMNRFGNDEVRAAFDQTGAGNHPAVVRFLTTLAAQLREPGPINPGGPQPAAGQSLEQRLYPNMTQ